VDIAEVRVIVRDSTGQALGYFTSTMSRNARRMAANFAKLRVMLRAARGPCKLNLKARWNVARRFLRTAKVRRLAHLIRQPRQQ